MSSELLEQFTSIMSWAVGIVGVCLVIATYVYGRALEERSK